MYESKAKIPYPSYLCTQRENYITPSAPSRRKPPSWASDSLCYNKYYIFMNTKENIINRLRETNRENIEKVIDDMEGASVG